jgi:hypothetical protein
MRDVYDTYSFREVKAVSLLEGLFRFAKMSTIINKLTVKKTIL